jgi:hypothetical protein
MNEEHEVSPPTASAVESKLQKSLTPTLRETTIIDPYAVWQHFGGDYGSNCARTAKEGGRHPICVVKKKYAVQMNRDNNYDNKSESKHKKRKQSNKVTEVNVICSRDETQQTLHSANFSLQPSSELCPSNQISLKVNSTANLQKSTRDSGKATHEEHEVSLPSASAVESKLQKSLTPTLRETTIIDSSTSAIDPYAVWQHFGGDYGSNCARTAKEGERHPICVVKKKYAVQMNRDNNYDNKSESKHRKRKKRSKIVSCPSSDSKRANDESNKAESNKITTDSGAADVVLKLVKKKKVRHNKSVKRRKRREREAADLLLTADRQVNNELSDSVQSKYHRRYQCVEDYAHPDCPIGSVSVSCSSLQYSAEESAIACGAPYRSHRDPHQHQSRMGPFTCVGSSAGSSRSGTRILDFTLLQVILQ